GVNVKQLPCKYETLSSPETDRTRMSVKIQDGCDNFCSYCLIPYLRGRSRSRSVEDTVAECLSVSGKTKEIVLTGIDISSYGKNIDSSLTYLLTRLSHINCRIRLGSLEAGVITPEFLAACKGLKDFCPQFHLSLQSGSDSVLRRMNRHYTTAEYADKVELIRKAFPYAGITTDLICGFPTESEEDFETTLEFLKKIGFSHIHVFGYSPRKGTAAEKLKLLNGDIVKRRCAGAQQVATECELEYKNKFIGRELRVLTEVTEGGYTVGFSPEYIRCYIEGAPKGEIVNAVAKELYSDGLICAMID
ncbi:MAG: MiaB/RimO family radical SAM methylthiotransferase, partial [Clostridia bacterium]|nr:MiaB/RimO family radical SAM methylthiotransferase [Clostridia bacterium]